MEIINNTLVEISEKDIIDGVFTAPDDVLYIGNGFNCNITIEKVILPNVIRIGHGFLYSSTNIEYLEAPKLKEIGNHFLYLNQKISFLNIPNVEQIGYGFVSYVEKIQYIDMPRVKSIGEFFLQNCENFNYTPRIIKAMQGDLYIDGKEVNKTEYFRKLNLKKVLC